MSNPHSIDFDEKKFRDENYSSHFLNGIQTKGTALQMIRDVRLINFKENFTNSVWKKEGLHYYQGDFLVEEDYAGALRTERSIERKKTMIKIVSFKICPFVQRVTGLLEAKKIPYEIEYINLSDKPQWFLDISPTGQVPVLVTDNGTALFESDAIVEYIDEVTSPLVPETTAEQRAINRAWSYQASKHYLVQCSNNPLCWK